MKDQIFAAPRSETEDFSFNEQVAEVFHDMAQRSIPGYSTIINTIGSLTAQYAPGCMIWAVHSAPPPSACAKTLKKSRTAE